MSSRSFLFLFLFAATVRDSQSYNWNKALEQVEQKLDMLIEKLGGQEEPQSPVDQQIQAFNVALDQKLTNFTSEVSQMLLTGKKKRPKKLKMEPQMLADQSFLQSSENNTVTEGPHFVTNLEKERDKTSPLTLKGLEKLLHQLHTREMRRLNRIQLSINQWQPSSLPQLESPNSCLLFDHQLRRLSDNMERDHKDVQQGVSMLQHQLTLDMGAGLRAMQVDILQCTRSVTELHKSIVGMNRNGFSKTDLFQDDPSAFVFNRHPRPIGTHDAYLQELPSIAVATNIHRGRPISCAEAYHLGYKKSGIFTIWPQFNRTTTMQVYAYCDMQTNGGGWTVIQRRGDFGGQIVNFSRIWSEYKRGFGHVSGEHWLGLDSISALSNQEPVVLRIELEKWNGNRGEVNYDTFKVADETDLYRLSVGNFSGNITDSFLYHDGSAFSTVDRNNAGHISRQCANNQGQGGGWWYNNCYRSKLNSPYYPQDKVGRGEGIQWMTWTGYENSLKFAEMKLRPLCFPDKCVQEQNQ